jgi:hypothetical protein
MPHSYPFILAELVHGIESLSLRCMGWALSLALLEFELGQGREATALGGTYDCASSETSSPIGLQLFSGFGFAGENDTERVYVTFPQRPSPCINYLHLVC